MKFNKQRKRLDQEDKWTKQNSRWQRRLENFKISSLENRHVGCWPAETTPVYIPILLLSMRLLTGEKDYKKKENIYHDLLQSPGNRGALEGNGKRQIFQLRDTPFLDGDTAWLLFHRLTEEETRNYLRNRKELGTI